MFETITPMLRLRPPARLWACRLGLYFSSCIPLRTRARVEGFPDAPLFRTRDTVAVETRALRATSSSVMPASSHGGGAARPPRGHSLQALCVSFQTAI